MTGDQQERLVVGVERFVFAFEKFVALQEKSLESESEARDLSLGVLDQLKPALAGLVREMIGPDGHLAAVVPFAQPETPPLAKEEPPTNV